MTNTRKEIEEILKDNTYLGEDWGGGITEDFHREGAIDQLLALIEREKKICLKCGRKLVRSIEKGTEDEKTS